MNSPPPSPDLAIDTHQLAEDIWPVLVHLRRQMRSVIADNGISPLQALVLVEILKNPGIGVGDLARRENVRSPTISGHVKALEAAGMLARTAPDPNDRRRVGLVVTDQGRAVVEALRRQKMNWLEQQLAKLSSDDRQAIAKAIGALTRLSQ